MIISGRMKKDTPIHFKSIWKSNHNHIKLHKEQGNKEMVCFYFKRHEFSNYRNAKHVRVGVKRSLISNTKIVVWLLTCMAWWRACLCAGCPEWWPGCHWRWQWRPQSECWCYSPPPPPPRTGLLAVTRLARILDELITSSLVQTGL